MGTDAVEDSARIKLEQELRDFRANPPTNISFGPSSIDDMLHWQGIIIGPVGTQFEGYIFQLSIRFPIDYPFSPPKVKFETKVCHPNIDEDGTIFIDILGDQWNPVLTTEQLLLSICSVLLNPIVEDYSVYPISDLYKHERDCYNKEQKGWQKQLLRCWSRIKSLFVIRTKSYNCKARKKINVIYQ